MPEADADRREANVACDDRRRLPRKRVADADLASIVLAPTIRNTVPVEPTGELATDGDRDEMRPVHRAGGESEAGPNSSL